MLGKPVVNSDGKKQTLLVSVTPFGEDATPRKYNNSTKSYSSSIVTNTTVKTASKESKTTSNIILTSYSNRNEEDTAKSDKQEKSLLDEISETLEKSNNSILGRRKTPLRETDPNVNGSNKENINTPQKEDKSDVSSKSERKINLTRTPALKSRDLEKPVIYQTSTAKIELLNSKNTKISRESLEITKVVAKAEEKSSDSNNNNNNLINKDIVLSPSSNLIKNEVELSTPKPSNEIPSTAKFNLTIAQSREQAGKPDGREDPEAPELPALPLTPPPTLENQTSFLHPHSPTTATSPIAHHPPLYEKPKIPSKPATVLIRKPVQSPNHIAQNQPMSTFTKEPLVKQDSNSDIDARTNKRRAPKPPEEAAALPVNLLPNNTPQLFTRNSAVLSNGDSPVVREKEKRGRNERASSCTPKMYVVNGAPEGVENDYQIPAPTPRKSLSISSDNLVRISSQNRVL